MHHLNGNILCVTESLIFFSFRLFKFESVNTSLCWVNPQIPNAPVSTSYSLKNNHSNGSLNFPTIICNCRRGRLKKNNRIKNYFLGGKFLCHSLSLQYTVYTTWYIRYRILKTLLINFAIEFISGLLFHFCVLNNNVFCIVHIKLCWSF